MRRVLFAFLFFLVINACSSAPRYPNLYDTGVSLSDGEIVTENSRAELLNNLLVRKAIWEDKQPNHYRYIVLHSTYFICGLHCGPNEVEVKDGEVVKVTFRGKRQPKYSNGYVYPREDWRYFSIESHFARAEMFLELPNDLIGGDWGDENFWSLTKYNDEYGYPKLIARNDPTDYHGQHETYIGYFEVIE